MFTSEAVPAPVSDMRYRDGLQALVELARRYSTPHPETCPLPVPYGALIGQHDHAGAQVA